ncbi:MAG TPA: hypothetical protein DDW52_27795 [Planctomycetaceae bacterium]|nr:hypothetical protein [Planctomycetaceae bacterium]
MALKSLQSISSARIPTILIIATDRRFCSYSIASNFLGELVLSYAQVWLCARESASGGSEFFRPRLPPETRHVAPDSEIEDS